MELSQQKLKTNSSPRKMATATPNEDNTAPEISKKLKPLVIKAKRGPLTTKKGIEFLLNGKLNNVVCRCCLNVTVALTEIDQCVQIAGRGALYSVAIRDILATVHPFKVADDPNLPDKICERCIDKALQSYLFAQQCEQSDRALRNYFNDMYDKLEKLDPLERTKKRGRQKQHPNHNVLHAEHTNVIEYAEPIINLINSGSVSLTNETPMGELECKKCWQVLPNIESLANHEKMHPKSMWYSCRVCAKSFSKRYQMNRHIRQHNKDKNLDLEKETDFLCKDCGQTNQNYAEHLQHIEKHKFKMVLDHLVSRQMDKLCSVCLDQKGKMVEMDKLICLHGGYPELTGDRTLYNILSSTVPEPNYKYQELMVANRPQIMTITKKNNTAVIADEQKPTGSFKLSFPLIISFDKEIYEESYLFLFGEPDRDVLIYVEDQSDDDLKNIDQKLTEIEIEELTETEVEVLTETREDLSGHEINAIEVEGTGNSIVDNQLVNIDFNKYTSFEFSEPDYDIDLTKTDTKKVLCKSCWIFKEPKCKICVENTKEDITSVDSVNEIKMQSSDATKECNYCWMFYNVEKCDKCQKPGKKEKNLKDSIETKECDTFEAAMKKIIDEQNRTSSRTIVAKKHKLLEEPVVFPKTKKSKWQCNVCLTNNNYNRETCICCECAKLCDGSVKVNLNPEKSKFTFPRFKPTETATCESQPNIASVPKLETIMVKYPETPKIVTKEETLKNIVGIQIIEPMDSSYPPLTPAVNIISTPYDFQETMDVVTEQEIPMRTEVSAAGIQFPTRMGLTGTEYPNPYSFAFTSAPIPSAPQFRNPFQFNIGARFSEERAKYPKRFKRPLRRIATLSHK